MKNSTLVTIMLIVFFLFLGGFGFYLNFINEVPDMKTFLFLVVLFVLGFITRKLILKQVREIEETKKETKGKLVNKVTGQL